MERLLALSLFSVALLVTSVAVAQPAVLAPSSAELAAAGSAGVHVDVEVDGRITEGRVVARVDAAPDEVQEAIADFAGQEGWVPDMENARIVSRSGEWVTGYAETNLPFPLTRRRYTLRIHQYETTVGGEPAWVAAWTLDDSAESNMEQNDGYWLVQPDGEDASIVTYVVIANAGIAAPDGIERNTTSRILPGIIEGLRDEVDG